MTAKTAGQLAFAEYYGRQAGASLDMPASWLMQSDATRADWEAAALAVTADYADYAELAADRDRLLALLGEVGTLAANAPEDDAFSVCEDIAMRIAAAVVRDDGQDCQAPHCPPSMHADCEWPKCAEPYDGRHPDGCTCQFCREDEREERAREELDDDTDNAIPDTEGGAW